MKKTFTIHGVATIFVFGLLGAPSIAADDIKIGVMAPLTGNVAYWGNNVLLGAQMAADEINSSGGVNGSKIQLVSLDTAGDKAQAVSVIKKLIDSGVLVIVGTPTSGETFAVGPIANQAKVVYISPGATAAGVGKIGPFVFKNTLDDTVGAPLAVQYMVQERKIKRAALVFSNNNDYAVGLNKIWTEALKKNSIQLVASVSYSDGDTDFSAQVTKLKEANPDAVFLSGVAAEGGLLIRQAKQQGLNAPFVSGDGLEDATLFKLAGPAANGTILYTGYSTKNPAQHSQTFVTAFTKKFGKEPQINNALAYDVVKIYAAAILKAGKNSDGIRRAITEIQKFPGVSGTTTFNTKTGDAVKPAFLEEVRAEKFELIKVLE